MNRLSGVLQGSQNSALFPNRIYSVGVLTLNIVIFRKRFSTEALVFTVTISVDCCFKILQ